MVMIIIMTIIMIIREVTLTIMMIIWCWRLIFVLLSVWFYLNDAVLIRTSIKSKALPLFQTLLRMNLLIIMIMFNFLFMWQWLHYIFGGLIVISLIPRSSVNFFHFTSNRSTSIYQCFIFFSFSLCFLHNFLFFFLLCTF